MIHAIKKFAKDCQFTHACPYDDKHITLFAIEKCEECDCEIRAANSLNVVAKIEHAGLAGLTVVEHHPPDGGYNDYIEGVTCDHCEFQMRTAGTKKKDH